MKSFLSPKEAATYLAIHPETLRRYSEKGMVNSETTPGGHRRYRKEDIDNLKEDLKSGRKQTFAGDAPVLFEEAVLNEALKVIKSRFQDASADKIKLVSIDNYELSGIGFYQKRWEAVVIYSLPDFGVIKCCLDWEDKDVIEDIQSKFFYKPSEESAIQVHVSLEKDLYSAIAKENKFNSSKYRRIGWGVYMAALFILLIGIILSLLAIPGSVVIICFGGFPLFVLLFGEMAGYESDEYTGGIWFMPCTERKERVGSETRKTIQRFIDNQ